MTSFNVLSRNFRKLVLEHSTIVAQLSTRDIVELHEHCAQIARTSDEQTNATKLDNAALTLALSAYPYYLSARAISA